MEYFEVIFQGYDRKQVKRMITPFPFIEGEKYKVHGGFGMYHVIEILIVSPSTKTDFINFLSDRYEQTEGWL
jgi:hypothetical protein